MSGGDSGPADALLEEMLGGGHRTSDLRNRYEQVVLKKQLMAPNEHLARPAALPFPTWDELVARAQLLGRYHQARPREGGPRAA